MLYDPPGHSDNLAATSGKNTVLPTVKIRGSRGWAFKMTTKSLYIASVPTSKWMTDRLEFEMQLRGIEVFKSPMNVRKPSESYVIGIEQADTFLCVIGEGSLDQAMFRQEIAYAMQMHKPILLAFHERFQITHSHKDTLKPLMMRFEHMVMSATKEDALENAIEQIMRWLKNPQAKPRTNFESDPHTDAQSYHIFLSYSRRDKEFVLRLHRDLTRQGFKVWIDQYELEPGTPGWENEIVSAIENSDCVVAIMSPDAAKSKWVGCELAKSDDLNRTIFPLLARGDAGHAIPLRLSAHQRVDATTNYVEALNSLMKALRRHLAASTI